MPGFHSGRDEKGHGFEVVDMGTEGICGNCDCEDEKGEREGCEKGD